ncbi:MAG: hypothetical protein ABR875_00710 [Minisyncoccia bacterium]|jgi:hypothetical protein
MKYAVDYTEKEANFVQWKKDGEPTIGKFTPFFIEKSLPNVPTEANFLAKIGTDDELYVLGTTVTETLIFIAAKNGAEVFRIFAPALKKIKDKLKIAKGASAVSAIHYAAMKKPKLFKRYIPPTADDYLLRRWVRIHYRFQKRFRTGTQATLILLEKEVLKLRSFGHLTESKAARKVGTRIEEVLEYAQGLEDKLMMAVDDSLKGRPLWEEVLRQITGISPKIGSKIVASGPRKRFANRDHFIASAGLYPKNGKAVRRQAGEMLLRESLLFDGFLQYMRNLHFHDCHERDVYAEKKQHYLGKGFPLWRADKAARRWVATHLARKIWKEWCKLEP